MYSVVLFCFLFSVSVIKLFVFAALGENKSDKSCVVTPKRRKRRLMMNALMRDEVLSLPLILLVCDFLNVSWKQPGHLLTSSRS